MAIQPVAQQPLVNDLTTGNVNVHVQGFRFGRRDRSSDDYELSVPIRGANCRYTYSDAELQTTLTGESAGVMP